MITLASANHQNGTRNITTKNTRGKGRKEKYV
jgi:hypothetical protein